MYALNRQETYKTDCDDNRAPVVTPIDKAINEVITTATVHGLSNEFDDYNLKEHIVLVEEIENNMSTYSSSLVLQFH